MDSKPLGHKSHQTVRAPSSTANASSVMVFFAEGAYKQAGEGLVTRAGSDGTRGDGFELKEGRLR